MDQVELGCAVIGLPPLSSTVLIFVTRYCFEFCDHELFQSFSRPCPHVSVGTGYCGCEPQYFIQGVIKLV